MAEKTLNDLPRDLRLLFTRGNNALQRDNFDYAIDLLNQVLAREPAVFECRQALRTAQMLKAGRGRSFFKKMMSTAGSSTLVAKGHLALTKDPVEALKIAEQILNSDPTNSLAHKLVVEAATALEYPRTAVLSLEILNANSPNDRDLAVKLANALADVGEVGRAEKILADLCQAAPHDQELAQTLKNLSARKTMDEGGYEALADGSGSYRDILKDKEEAVSLEQQNRQVKSEDVAERLIAEYEGRLQTEPKNLKLVRQLAELYTQKQQFDRALACYDKIKASEIGGDASLDRSIADTVARKYDHEISQLDTAAADYPDKLAKLQADKQDYQLAECQKRVERFPTDLQIRFELGQLFFQTGKITDAMKEFQKSQGNPHRRIQSLSYLGQCFARRGIHDLAASTFQEALKEKPVFDDEKKDLIYLLGSVYEKMGRRDDAIAQFKLIYAVDVGYKDVADKIDAYYGGQAGA